MYLKTLTLSGFKSFADRTRLEFEPGVSVVVGPNGVGKSNIVDAVSWVLGSRFTRALRTDRMDDVIFAGTETRSPHSRAEVTAVFDNSRRLLPLELDEVSLTRRLNRGGTSGYEINGVQCRLLDVQELLSDGGVGRRQHLIVGQGRLNSLLAADGDHRRRIIEEAAGILKHRIRKERAIRRLEKTDRDVLRLHDVVRELERRRRPLKRQAAAAQSYERARSELRALRLWLGGENLRVMRDRRRELEIEQAEARRYLEIKREDLDALKKTLVVLEANRADAVAALDGAAATRARLETGAARLQGIAQVARERVRGLTARLEGAAQRRANLEDEADRLSGRLIESTEQEEEARRSVGSAQAAFDLHADRLRSRPVDHYERVESEWAVASAELRAVEEAVHRDAGEEASLEVLVEQAEALLAEDAESLQSLERGLDETVGRLEAARRAADARALACSDLEEARERAERERQAATTRRIEARARLSAVEEAAGSPAPGAGNVSEGWDGVRGPLGAILNIPARLVPAVEAALGSWAEGLVLDGTESVRAALARLEAEGRGGFPLLHGETPAGEPISRSPARPSGVEPLLDALNSTADHDLVSHLLGDVMLVAGWETGLEFVRANPGIRAVTPDGGLITSFGARPPDPDRLGPGAIEAFLRELEAASAAETETDRAESAVSARLARARRSESSAREQERTLREERNRVTSEMDRKRRRRASARRETARLMERLDALRKAAAERKQRRADLAGKVASLREIREEHRKARRELLSRRADAEAELRSAGLARDDAIRRMGEAAERRRFLDTRLESVKAELARLGDAVPDYRELRAARSVRRLAGRTGAVVEDKAGELGERVQELAGRVKATDGIIAGTRRKVSTLESAIEDRLSRSGELAAADSGLRAREEALLEGLRRDADATEEEALAAPSPPTETGDPQARVSSLAAELSRLGPVNLLAGEEFDELDERYRMIRDQISDLERSRAEMGKVIAALDEEMERRFTATFEETARHYRHHFAELFPGGTGRLTLDDARDPSAGGVEIEAQPLGKKIGKLALLSGGERSLAALAFLFAVFKARPGPFYILDEVDAALDDANLRRFLRLVDGFRDQAQLIVVTHQQATVQAADVLYGVTMEPGGSSQALVRRMDEASVPA